MRIFHVEKSYEACKVACYFIRNRIGFHPSYTWPDRQKGSARFTFRLVKHIADNPTEMDLFANYLATEGILVNVDKYAY